MEPASPSLDLAGTGYCASFNFRRVSRAVTALFDDALQESGLRSTQFAILTAVAKTQPVSISAISSILVIDATTLTRSLNLLRKLGFLTVSPRGARRQRFLNLTSDGEKALSVAIPLWRNIQQKFVGQIGDTQWRALRAQLEDLSKLAILMGGKPKVGL
jgi:MarR family transcriptional regulator, organic hydroperoxide resistance regulator